MTADLFTQLCIWASLNNLPKPTPEHQFHPVRKWRLDFAWPNLKLAVEYEGTTRSGSRHQRQKGFSEDATKYNTAAVMGWVVIRVTALNVSQVLNWLDEALKVNKASGGTLLGEVDNG